MKAVRIYRRQALASIAKILSGIAVLLVERPLALAAKLVKAPAQPGGLQKTIALARSEGAPEDYNPLEHHWQMVIDIEKCIGCGLCVQACKRENKVPPEPWYFRTWIERFIIKRAPSGSVEQRGATVVDSPNGGFEGFPPSPVPREQILKSFFVPKLCNLCVRSPCTQSCPVGATFDAPDGAVLIDKKYCIGCGFCIQACPYGCRFLNPITKTAEKCSLCYHRITRGKLPACVEVCPNGARIFGDLMDSTKVNPVRAFLDEKKVQVLKPHLGTSPKLLYAGLDKEVR